MKKNLIEVCKIGSIIVITLAVLSLLGIGCPFQFFLGVPCAGCGMTRAWISVFSLQFAEAYTYHPLYWTIPIMLILLVVRDSIPKKVYYGMIGLWVLAFVTVFFVRLFDPMCSIVKVHINNGLFGKIIRKLTGG